MICAKKRMTCDAFSGGAFLANSTELFFLNAQTHVREAVQMLGENNQYDLAAMLAVSWCFVEDICVDVTVNMALSKCAP